MQRKERIDQLVGDHAARLSERLMAHRAQLFPPDAHKELRRFSSGEVAALLGVKDAYLRKLSLEGRGPQPATGSGGRRLYTSEDIRALRELLEAGTKTPGTYVPGRRKGDHLQVITVINFKGGSGKTTILKLLLKSYQPTMGQIIIGTLSLNAINHHYWRSKCGVVMQDGFIFSDTIARNIAVGEDDIDFNKLYHAVRVANIAEYIETLPLGYNTKIGAEGNGLSQGQKQRILIARAVYKEPEFMFFDEATNALDANNEKIIMKNLEEFFQGRTVIIVAHRLSTVKNAHQIVVVGDALLDDLFLLASDPDAHPPVRR